MGSNPAQGNSSCFSFTTINQLISGMGFISSFYGYIYIYIYLAWLRCTTCVGHLRWLYKLNLHPRHQHCTDEAQAFYQFLVGLTQGEALSVCFFACAIAVLVILWPLQ